MPKREIKSVPTLLKHSHCPICGMSIGLDKVFCGKECGEEFNKAPTRRKITNLALVIIMLVSFSLPLLYQYKRHGR